MNRSTSALLKLILIAGFVFAGFARADGASEPSVNEGPLVAPGSALRSAFLSNRAGVWTTTGPRTPNDERAGIQAHFATVAAYLVATTPASLDLAVSRFEDFLGRSLTPQERSDIRARLSVRRALQLVRLAEYSRHGSFPLNRHYGETRPIFVDAKGTHCAVGHLMALDGREREVNAIARARPNVLVMEVQSGPLVDWVLTSGLVQEEAALIQPGYSPDAGADSTPLSVLVVPGAFLNRNGYRYENFTFLASSSGGAATPDVSQFRVVYGWPPGSILTCGSQCITSPNTLWIGLASTMDQPGIGESVGFDIQYDVVAVEPGADIGSTYTFADDLYGGIWPGYGAPASTLSTSIDDGALGSLTLSVSYQDTYKSGSVQFPSPTSQIHLRHSALVNGPASFMAFRSYIRRGVTGGGTAQDDVAPPVTVATAQVIKVGANDVGFTNPASITVFSPPAQGSITAISPPGTASGLTLTYQANANAAGPDSFMYEISDGTGIADRATVAVSVLPDGDHDGMADAADNCTLVPNPNQCDSDNDGYGNHCDADFNRDLSTNAQDVALFRSWLGLAVLSAPPYSTRDLNCNGHVNAQDTVMLRSLLGSPPGPSALQR